MAVYRDAQSFQRNLKIDEIENRTDFLRKVRWATIEDPGDLPSDEAHTALLFAMKAGLLPSEHLCDECGERFRLKVRNRKGGHATWEWRQDSRFCNACYKSSRSLTTGTILQDLKSKNFMKFFDCVVMWTLDYPAQLAQREAAVHHKQHNEWQNLLHSAVSRDLARSHKTLSISSVPPKCANKVRKVVKSKSKAAKGKGVLKKPANKKFVAHTQKATQNATNFYKKYKYVIEIDESHLNKAKAGALSKSSRVQADQVWVWGATIPNHPERFLFRVLDHPDDVFDGKPRGKDEILKCLRLLDIKKKTILVTDGWKGTKAAVKALREELGWTEKDLWHEVVNHSAGEITNANGFTTNHIENRWSIIKRWIRKRMGGMLPRHNDRLRWKQLLNEFHWRKIASKGRNHEVPLKEALRILRCR